MPHQRDVNQTISQRYAPNKLMAVNPPFNRIRLLSRIVTPATVHETDDTKNKIKPQPDMGRLRAISVAPAMPNSVPVHLVTLMADST